LSLSIGNTRNIRFSNFNLSDLYPPLDTLGSSELDSADEVVAHPLFYLILAELSGVKRKDDTGINVYQDITIL